MKSKDELLAELKQNKDFVKKMDFTRNSVYPRLIDATTSIEDALEQLYMINSVIMQGFLELMKEKLTKELKIVDKLSQTDPKYLAMKTFLELFDEKSVFETKEVLEGLRNEINLFVSEENKKRSLADLKTTWIDEL